MIKDIFLSILFITPAIAWFLITWTFGWMAHFLFGKGQPANHEETFLDTTVPFKWIKYFSRDFWTWYGTYVWGYVPDPNNPGNYQAETYLDYARNPWEQFNKTFMKFRIWRSFVLLDQRNWWRKCNYYGEIFWCKNCQHTAPNEMSIPTCPECGSEWDSSGARPMKNKTLAIPGSDRRKVCSLTIPFQPRDVKFINSRFSIQLGFHIGFSFLQIVFLILGLMGIFNIWGFGAWFTIPLIKWTWGFGWWCFVILFAPWFTFNAQILKNKVTYFGLGFFNDHDTPGKANLFVKFIPWDNKESQLVHNPMAITPDDWEGPV